MTTLFASVTYYPRREDTYKCEFQVSLSKTEAGIRNVPMMDEVYNVFKEEAVRQKEDGICNTMEVDGMSGFIFANRFGNLHNPQAINLFRKESLMDVLQCNRILQVQQKCNKFCLHNTE